MLDCRLSAVGGMAVLALGLSASEGSAEQKLCVSSTGATRVVETPEKCRKIETAVKIPEAVKGETIKSSSYRIPGSGAGGYLSLTTADGMSELIINCYPSTDVRWFANDPSITAGDVQIFNAISGQTFQAFNDLQWNAGSQDPAVVPARPWTGVFSARYGTSLTRFEVTVSEISPGGDCLITLFSIGLGTARIIRY